MKCPICNKEMVDSELIFISPNLQSDRLLSWSCQHCIKDEEAYEQLMEVENSLRVGG